MENLAFLGSLLGVSALQTAHFLPLRRCIGFEALKGGESFSMNLLPCLRVAVVCDWEEYGWGRRY